MSNAFERVAPTCTGGNEQAAAPGRDAPPGAHGPVAAPRLVTRGERETTRPNAFTDWLSFTVGEDHFKRAVDWVPALREYLQVPDLAHAVMDRGVAGFAYSAELVLPCNGETVTVGKLAWGGRSNGAACISP